MSISLRSNPDGSGTLLNGSTPVMEITAAGAYVTRLKATGTGNSYYESGIEVLGNGAANTAKPSLGFHQPGVFAGTLQQENYELFRFYKQDGSLAKLEIAAGAAANHAVNFGQFANSLSSNGYQRLPSGLIIQWGYSGWACVTFPIAFPNATFAVLNQFNGGSHEHGINSVTKTGFCPTTNGTTSNFYWLAVGY